MRIAYVGTLPPHPGGSAIHGIGLLTGLGRRGHEISAISPITAEAVDVLTAAPFKVARYLVPYYENAPGRPSSDEFRANEGRGVMSHLVPLLEAARPDLIVAGRETFAWHVADPARRYGRPWVVIAHGGVTWGLLDGAYPRDLMRALVRRLGQADRVIAVAHHQAERLRELGLEKVEVVRNAVDPDAFVPAPRERPLMRSLHITDEQVVVAHVSNLKDVKRPFDVVHSAAVALRHDPRLLYLVVGDGPNRARMAAECDRLGVLDHFRFPGWVPHEEVPRYLNLADIVVMPSENEAMAFAYLETQACGRVLVATDIPGAREVVANGVNGLLVEAGNISALADATLRAAADPVLRSAIGAQGRASAMARPLARALDEFDAIFTTVIGEHGGSRRA